MNEFEFQMELYSPLVYIVPHYQDSLKYVLAGTHMVNYYYM